MLDQIDTGYEGKFDFPAREQAPEITYLLATVPAPEARTSATSCGKPAAWARRSNI